MSFEDTNACTLSPASPDGNWLCLSPVGTDDPSGPVPAPASRSAKPDNGKVRMMSGTCGPLFTASSPSADLQFALESRLRARMDVNGSPEYGLIWSIWDMPSGLPICRLRASAHPMFGKEYSGYPTVRASDRGPRNPETAKRKLRANGRTKHHRIEDLLTALGTRTGYPNPRFLSWMMGFPRFWDTYAPTATPSTRTSRQSS